MCQNILHLLPILHYFSTVAGYRSQRKRERERGGGGGGLDMIL